MKKLNLATQIFGNWTVIKEDTSVITRGRTYWLCRCVCGVERAVAGTSLTSEISTSCGCAGGLRKPTVDASDFLARRFGRLLVISIHGYIIDYDGKQRTAYVCQCDCGKEVIVQRHALQNKNGVKSCGCLLAEQRSELGLSKRKYEPRIATARLIFEDRYSDGDLAFENFMTLSQHNCHYCGIEPSATYNKFIHRGGAKNSQYAMDNGHFTYNGLDRIDSSLPHNLANVVPCCIMCNTAKSNYSQEEIGSWICQVYHFWARKYDTKEAK